MSANKTESLHFYDYLCLKIGSEKEVKGRRLTLLAFDTLGGQLCSGSKSEGLDLKGSDIDLMYIDPDYIVYESKQEVVYEQVVDKQSVALIMDTIDTQPSFTRLHLYTDYNRIDKTYRKMLEQHGMNYLLSNEFFKQYFLENTPHLLENQKLIKIHGPCISDCNENFDFAWCLKCEKWVSQAVPWLNRPRSSWLSPEIISKIAENGVLFVPIGLKGSKNENLEWRISFSMAEKVLIFSFNHTQLLCYALLKIVLKEIIEKDEDLKGLLCSYYLKTLMFWISDDSDPTVWRPHNIIQCFMACLQRLLYSVEYLILSHYFIPDFNFLDLRLSTDLEKKNKLINLLKILFQQGIQCFSTTETLHDYTRSPPDTYVIKQINMSSRLVYDVLHTSGLIPRYCLKSSIPKLLNHFLHHSKTDLSHDIFIAFISSSHQQVPQIPYTEQKHYNNKQLYYKYKYDLSHLLIGLHSDAAAGWLMLASFFYVHENYLTSLDIANYTLSKLTDEKCCNQFGTIFHRIILTPKQQSALDEMTKEKLITTFKALTVNNLLFEFKSRIVPEELKQNVERRRNMFPPLTFSHFIRFLCYYHLHDHFECEIAIQQLFIADKEILHHQYSIGMLHIGLLSSVLAGIAGQMMFGTDFAKQWFELITKLDHDNLTGARTRLCALRMDHKLI